MTFFNNIFKRGPSVREMSDDMADFYQRVMARPLPEVTKIDLMARTETKTFAEVSRASSPVVRPKRLKPPRVTVPPPPDGVLQRREVNDVYFAWNKAPGAVSYEIGYTTNPDTTQPYTNVVPAPVNFPNQAQQTYTIAGLTSSNYYLGVRSVFESGGHGPWSKEVKALKGPTGLSASAGSADITLNWTASSIPGAVYNVWRSSTAPVGGSTLPPASSFSLIIAGNVSTSYVDHGVSVGVTFYYKVSANSSATGETGYSNTAHTLVASTVLHHFALSVLSSTTPTGGGKTFLIKTEGRTSSNTVAANGTGPDSGNVLVHWSSSPANISSTLTIPASGDSGQNYFFPNGSWTLIATSVNQPSITGSTTVSVP